MNNTEEQIKMDLMGKLLIAKMYQIEISECRECPEGNDGVPDCKPGECDLPIELKNDQYGKIKVLVSELKDGRWQFPFNRNEDYNTYFLLAFSENWENIEKVYAIPKGDMEDHMDIFK